MKSSRGGIQMKKLVCAFAILAAAAVSTAAVAKDLKQDKKVTAPAVSAIQMSDAEMDKVTAGGNPAGSTGLGLATSELARNGFPVYQTGPGYGVCATGQSGSCFFLP